MIKEVANNYEIARNFLRYGKAGDFVENGNRKAVRISTQNTTLPTCAIIENGKCINYVELNEALQFLQL